MTRFTNKTKFVLKHIMRSPVRTALLAGLFVFNIIAVTFFLGAIESSSERIDYLYLNTYVTGAIVRDDVFATTKAAEPVVSAWGVNQLRETGFLQDMYLEIIDHGFAIIPRNFHPMLVVSCFDTFMHHNEPRAMQAAVPGFAPFGGPLVIEFAEGFTSVDLKNNADIIPVLFHTTLLQRFGFNIGEYVYVTRENDTRLRVHIIGSIMGGHPVSFGRFNDINRPLILMYYGVYHTILSGGGSYASVEFTINPAHNRDLDYFRTEVGGFISRGAAQADPDIPLTLTLNDSELRFVVVPLEQNLSLLRQLWPVVIILTCILAGAVSFLLMMQNAKLAAILRVLGTSKIQTQLILFLQQVVVCILGVIIGGVVAFYIGFSIELLIVIALFLGSTAVSSIVAVVLITSHQPLTLIQVKE